MADVLATATRPVEGTASASDDRRPLVAVLGAAAAFYAVFIWRTSWVAGGSRRFTLFDDAMISMTYARTLAGGDGVVWYPGAPDVEGFTNPLWVVIMAGLHSLGLSGSGVALAVMVLGATLCLVAALLAVAIARQLTATTPGIDAAVAGLVAFSYPLVFWSLRGMEVGLMSVLTLTAVWLALRLDRDRSGARTPLVVRLCGVLALGVTTRLDFFVVAAAVIGWLVWRSPRARRAAIGAPLVSTVLVCMAAQELWRHAYYGAWVPNTYTLKTAGVPLVDRLTRGGWVSVAASIGFLAAAGVLLVVARRRGLLARPSGTALLALVAIALLGYSTSVGGDAWEWMAHPNRYLVPGVLLATIAAAAATADLLRDEAGRDRRVVQVVSLAGTAALLGPWVGFAVLSASGVGAEARIDLDGAQIVLLGAGLLVATLVIVRRLADTVRSASASRATVITIIVLAVGANLLPMLQWLHDGGAYRSVDQRATELGLVLQEVTDPGARIAVVSAGAPIYYSERAGIDLLGKNDAVVAALPSQGRFLPGHTKRDYEYSIIEQRPDVITQLFRPTAADFDLVTDAGYELMTVQDQDIAPFIVVLLVREDSDLVDRDRLLPASDEIQVAYFSP